MDPNCGMRGFWGGRRSYALYQGTASAVPPDMGLMRPLGPEVRFFSEAQGLCGILSRARIRLSASARLLRMIYGRAKEENIAASRLIEPVRP